MRPVALTFSGLRSYRDTTSIDFSRLDLFAIIGDTGAGKSTIIEALSLALYAKKSWTGGPAGLADLIADGVTTMRVVLRFQADGHEWVVTRARHRNAAAPIDKLTSPTGGGPNVDGARAVTERVTELVGLDHDQFTRAVVLPQGRFDLLLRATERERTEILSTILGLGDIALTRQQAERTRDEWNERAVEMRVRRGNLPADPAAELAAATAHAAGAESRLAALNAARAVAVEADRRTNESGRSLDRLRFALAAVPEAPLDPAAELRALHARAVELHAERQRAVAAAAAADATLGAVDAKVVVVRAGFATHDLMAAARTSLAGVAQAVDKDLERVAALEAERIEHAAVVPPEAVDRALVIADRDAREAVEAAMSQLTEVARERRDATVAWRALTDARAATSTCRAAVTAAEAPMTDLGAAVATAEAALADAEQRAAEAADAERAALVAGAVARAAAGRSAGDECPVCAQPLPTGFDPPVAPDDVAVAAARQASAGAVIEHRRARDAAVQCLRDAERTLDDARRRLVIAASAADERERSVALIGLDVAAAGEDRALAPMAQAVDTATIARDVAVTAGEQVGRALAVAAMRLEDARRAHAARAASLEGELDAARARCREHATTVAALPMPWRPAVRRVAVDEVLVRLDDALDALDAIEAERDGARRAAADGRARVTALDARLGGEITLESVQVVVAANRRAAAAREVIAAIGSEADGCAPADLDVIADVAADPAAMAALVSAASRHGERIAAVLAAADRARTDLASVHDAASRALTAALGAAGAADLEGLHAAVGRCGSERDAAVGAVAVAERAVAEVGRLDGIRAVLDPFVANLKLLAVALRDQHFVAYLVRARESELLAEATRRLKAITGGRFGFTAGFGVVDIASGEVRTPDTLSGGERFQAALALALGLVEIASRGGGRLDAVFVDEGFGSLDAGALDTALDTLGKVAGGGKMVALISHLRPVAEYVDTVLHVTRDDVLGSRIDVLDPDARERLLADEIRSGLTA